MDNRVVGLELLNFKYYYQFFKRSKWELQTLRHPKRTILYKNRALPYGYLYERRRGFQLLYQKKSLNQARVSIFCLILDLTSALLQKDAFPAKKRLF